MIHTGKYFPVLGQKAKINNKEFVVADYTKATVLLESADETLTLHWAPSKNAWQTDNKVAVDL